MEKLSSIILVDDDATTNYINEALLRGLGVTDTVLSAHNGVEALALLEQPDYQPSPAHPALLLLDLAMPQMNGMDFLATYQNLPEAMRASIRIVILTGSMTSEELARLNELPIAGLAIKPLTAEKINTILQVHFQRSLPGG